MRYRGIDVELKRSYDLIYLNILSPSQLQSLQNFSKVYKTTDIDYIYVDVFTLFESVIHPSVQLLSDIELVQNITNIINQFESIDSFHQFPINVVTERIVIR